jgi:nucleoside-diphosphate-sugar epimerase
MRVMVIGASGFIGRPLSRILGEAGHDVVPVSRHGAGVDRADAGALAALASRERIEAVIDLLAYTLADTQPVLEALAGRVGRYVMASSGDVYRAYGALRRKEPLGAPPGPLAETAPLRARLFPYRVQPRRPADDPQAWLDDYDKIPVEAAAMAAEGFETVIMRLPMVFGPGDRQRRFAWAIGPMAAGAATIDIDAAWAAWRTTYGYVDDVAAGLALAAAHPAAAGRIYNLGLAEAPDHAAWAARFADILGWTGELRRIPREQVGEPLRSGLDAMDLANAFLMDTGRIRAELGYAEPTPPDAALRRTIDDELNRSAAA